MNLEEWYESVTAERLRELVEAHQEEHLQLEFKRAASADLTNKSDRENLATSLSGFANSGGGIVVWGVDARKTSQGIDAATGICPIENVGLFVSRLNEATGSATTPIVDGVRHRAIELGGGAGAAVSLIPEGTSGPYMAKAHLDRFYKRSGDRFYRMEHFDIADMFGRRRKPVLRFETSLAVGGMSGGGGVMNYQGRLTFGVRNVGRGPARSIYLAITPSAPYGVSEFGVTGNGHEGLPRIPKLHGGAIKYGGNGLTILHPNVSLEVGVIKMDVAVAGGNTIHTPAPLVIQYEMAAEDAELTRGEFRLTSQEIAAAVLPQDR